MTWLLRSRHLMVVLAGGLAIAAVPFVHWYITTGDILPDVLPSLQGDMNFYLPQVREVLDGHFGIGNPYIKEYAHLISQTMLLPIWMTALPAVLGLDIRELFAFNVIFYTLAHALLLYALLLRLTENRKTLSVVSALLGTLYVHDFLIRPAVMQAVYPVFLIFLLLLHLHFSRPQERRLILLIGITAALSFYHYLYLWMTVFTSLGAVFLFYVGRKDTIQILAWAVAGIGIIVLCLPQILQIVGNLGDPLMQESAFRVGLIETRALGAHVFSENKYTLFIALVLIALRVLRRSRFTAGELTLLVACIGVAGTAVSNVITGKDMELYTHVWRFGLIINGLAAAFFLSHVPAKIIPRFVALGSAAVLLLTMFIRIALPSKPFFYLYGQEPGMHEVTQAAAVPLRILNDLPGEAVILASPELSTLITIYTPHYVLHDEYAPFHIARTTELFERFVLQNLPYIDEALVTGKLQDYAGFGPGYIATLRNRQENNASAHQRYDIAREMGLIDDFETVRGQIQSDIDGTMQRFGVTHVVIDRTTDRNPPLPPKSTTLYQDERWTILSLP